MGTKFSYTHGDDGRYEDVLRADPTSGYIAVTNYVTGKEIGQIMLPPEAVVAWFGEEAARRLGVLKCST